MKIYILVVICFPAIFACAFTSEKKNDRPNFANGTHWFKKKFTHEGKQLSENDLIHLSSLSNEAHFKELLNPIMVPRVVDTPQHAAVRRHLTNEMRSLGWTVEEHSFEEWTPHGRKTFTNIITTLDPSAPRRLVLACHYDSKLTPVGFIGATDSAVPCAMLLNVASVLKSSLNVHRARGSDLTLQLIFFDGEEAFDRWTATDSLYGSRKLAEKLHNSKFPQGNGVSTTELHRMDLFLLLDLIGTPETSFYSLFRDTDHWFERLQLYEQQLKKHRLLSRRTPIFKDRKLFGAGIEDDHIPFHRKDVPILHLISVPFPTVWHKIGDDHGALHYPTIKDINLLVTAFVADYLFLPL